MARIRIEYRRAPCGSKQADTPQAGRGAPSIAATDIVTGLDTLRWITFASPDNPGDYFFHCEVERQQMQGTLIVER